MILKQHRITGFVLVLAIAALFASPASARPIDEVGPASDPAPQSTAPTQTSPRSEVVSGHGYGSPVQMVRVPSQPDGGFDWGDAGIGAGAAFAVTMIGLGGALVLSSRRRRQQSDTAVA